MEADQEVMSAAPGVTVATCRAEISARCLRHAALPLGALCKACHAAAGHSPSTTDRHVKWPCSHVLCGLRWPIALTELCPRVLVRGQGWACRHQQLTPSSFRPCGFPGTGSHMKLLLMPVTNWEASVFFKN